MRGRCGLSNRVIPVYFVGILLYVSSPAPAWEAETNAVDVWDILYRSRPELSIRSGQATYLRRFYSETTTGPTDATDGEGDSRKRDRQPSPERKETSADPRVGDQVSRVWFEKYTVQDGRFLVELQEYDFAPDAPLEQLDVHCTTPTQSMEYSWDGEKSVAITRIRGQKPAVSITSSPYRIPRFVEFGRGADAMPSTELWLEALRLMNKDLRIAGVCLHGRDLLVLTVGREYEPGYFLYVEVDPILDHAVRRVVTKLDGFVVTYEEYTDFERIDGLFTPRRAVRQSFRVEGFGSLLSTKEEFLRVGDAMFNCTFSPDELRVTIPEDAVVADLRAASGAE